MKNNLINIKIKKFKITKLLMLCLFILNVEMTQAQKEDFVWPLGSPSGSTIEGLIEDSINKLYWPFDFNFNEDPMRIDYKLSRISDPNGTLSSICTKSGDLFCYSHGRSVFDSNSQFAINGDTIGFDQYWKLWEHPKYNFGYRIPQGVLILPFPGYADSVFYMAMKYDYLKDVQTGVYWGIIAGYKDGLQARVVNKDNLIDHGFLGSGMTKAVRHANGRDWWIILISGDNTTYYTYLLDPSGLKLRHVQNIGKKQSGFNSGNAAFSYDGSRYAIIDGRYIPQQAVISIYDFDRCSGLLSNPHHKEIYIPKFSLGQSVVFSPNGNFLYANSDSTLYQIELNKANYPINEIAHFDGFQSLPDPSFYFTPFGFWAEGPDGRHYNVSGAGTALHMHVMDYPNEAGEACSFRQHAIRIPNNPWTIPNFPHYRLGPLDGSPCDTLGLDNNPIAKYRYEADSIDFLRLRFIDLSYFRPETWSWDFGDGSPSMSMQSPYHTFSKKGTYNVCLTVSNENSSNTVCRTITLGTSSSDDKSVSRADISLFPNPVQDYLLVTLGEYVPAYGQIMIYDITGRPVITQHIYYGQNNVDMRGLQAVMYVWKVMDGTQVIREGKVVKI